MNIINATYYREAQAQAEAEARAIGLKRFRVSVEFNAEVDIEIDALSMDEAKEKATDEVSLSDVWDWDVSTRAVELSPGDEQAPIMPDHKQRGLWGN